MEGVFDGGFAVAAIGGDRSWYATGASDDSPSHSSNSSPPNRLLKFDPGGVKPAELPGGQVHPERDVRCTAILEDGPTERGAIDRVFSTLLTTTPTAHPTHDSEPPWLRWRL